jgi:hypothetical protein
MKFHSLPVWIHTGIAECSICILYRNPYGRYSQGVFYRISFFLFSHCPVLISPFQISPYHISSDHISPYLIFSFMIQRNVIRGNVKRENYSQGNMIRGNGNDFYFLFTPPRPFPFNLETFPFKVSNILVQKEF